MPVDGSFELVTSETAKMLINIRILKVNLHQASEKDTLVGFVVKVGAAQLEPDSMAARACIS